jgi:hypothetical protein
MVILLFLWLLKFIFQKAKVIRILQFTIHNP